LFLLLKIINFYFQILIITTVFFKKKKKKKKRGIELSCVKSKEYLGLTFHNRNVISSLKEDEKICIICILSIRNANDFSCFHAGK